MSRSIGIGSVGIGSVDIGSVGIDPDRIDPDRIDPDRIDPDRIDPVSIRYRSGVDRSVPHAWLVCAVIPAMCTPSCANRAVQPDDRTRSPQDDLTACQHRSRRS